MKLDLLRVILAAAVFLFHIGLLPGGYLAVPAFFTLSAYLSANSLLKEKNISLKDHYLRRLKKLYLPLLAVAFVCVAVFSGERFNWVEMKSETLSVLFSYNNYWQLKANLDYFTRHIASPFMHLWFIAILVQLELLLPLFVLLLRKCARSLSRIAPLLLCLILVFASYIVFLLQLRKSGMMQAYYGTFARCHAYLLGVLQAFFVHLIGRPGFREKKTADLLYFVYLAVLAVFFIFVDAASPFFAVAMILSSLICIRMTDYAALGNETLFGENFDAVILLLAKISYEFYLVQYPWIFFFQNTSLPAVLQGILVFLLTLLSALFLHFAFDLRKGKTRIVQLALCLLLTVASLFGGYTWLKAEDHSEQTEEMKQKMEENRQLIEQKNSEYYNNVAMQEEERRRFVEGMENKEEAVSELLKQLPVTAIGDSIMLDLVNQLYERFPNIYIDSEISRDLYSGNKILQELKDQGKLADIILLSLSVNGDYREKYCEELMEIADGREVFWVDAVGPDDPNFNERFAEFAKRYDNLHIVEWVKASRGHPEYFYYDQIHVIGAGVPALAKEIYDTVYNYFYLKYADISQEFLDKQAEEARKRIAFYGNGALINAYETLSDAYPGALYNAKEYDYELLYEEIEEKVNANTLEYRLVFLFDKQAGLNEKNYRKLMELCQGHEVYIISLTKKKPEIENATVIDFYAEIKTHPEYLLKDKVHLSEEGNKALTASLQTLLQP